MSFIYDSLYLEFQRWIFGKFFRIPKTCKKQVIVCVIWKKKLFWNRFLWLRSLKTVQNEAVVKNFITSVVYLFSFKFAPYPSCLKDKTWQCKIWSLRVKKRRKDGEKFPLNVLFPSPEIPNTFFTWDWDDRYFKLSKYWKLIDKRESQKIQADLKK